MQQYCLYLRKSRADLEAEAHNEGETLARHEKLLLEVAKKSNYNVTQIYKEIVSGETIASRPIMQQLLSEVEQGIWTGVLVVEVERLARGDTIDQGIVAQTFKYSSTLIITPLKIYDPNNEYDEEFFEFGLFMSRREYKTINRRLQRGRTASVKEGKYLGSKPPYGYKRVRIDNDKGFTLAPDESEADTVKLIFELYTKGELQSDGTYSRIGTALIARRLNDLKIQPRYCDKWVVSSIRDILINPVYIGKIRWNRRQNVKKMVDGQLTISRPRSDNYILVDGLHPALISKETFESAQNYMNQNPPTPIPRRSVFKNPLNGLVICGKCGRHMIRRPYSKANRPDTLMCQLPGCENVSSFLCLVENKILQALEDWLNKYNLEWIADTTTHNLSTQADIKRKNLKSLKSELSTYEKQLSKTYDLLEQEIYDTETFLSRSRTISEKIKSAKENIASLQNELAHDVARQHSMTSIIPKVENLLSVYHNLSTPKAKNEMLKEVLEKVVYTKSTNTRWHGTPNDFQVEVYPKIPHSPQ